MRSAFPIPAQSVRVIGAPYAHVPTLLSASRHVPLESDSSMSEALVRQAVLDNDMIPVVHLTTSMAIRRIGCEGVMRGANGVEEAAHNGFCRSGAVFAYPDRTSIPWNRMFHRGEASLVIFVDPDRVFVADHDLAGRFTRDGKLSIVDRSAEPSAAYYTTAMTLSAFRANGGTRFEYPEVVIPASASRYLFVPPRHFTPLPTRTIEPWEEDYERAIRPLWPLPHSPVHAWEHALRSADTAAYLAEHVAPEHRKAVIVGAYLHDIGRKADKDPDNAHGRLGARIAARYFPADITPLEGASILFGIAHHADRGAPDGSLPITRNFPEIAARGLVEGIIACIWDADRLELRRVMPDVVDERYLSTEPARRLLADYSS